LSFEGGNKLLDNKFYFILIMNLDIFKNYLGIK